MFFEMRALLDQESVVISDQMGLEIREHGHRKTEILGPGPESGLSWINLKTFGWTRYNDRSKHRRRTSSSLDPDIERECLFV